MTRSAPAWRAWLREPLLHFVLVGGALFGVDQLLLQRTDDPGTIVFSMATEQSLKTAFQASRGREPNAAELKALRERWVDNEVLYREGLALQVDRGDTAIRDRVIFKALSVVDANTRLPPYDEQTLRRWFESQRARYDQPARYDFHEAMLVGDKSEDGVRRFVAALNAGAPGDAQAGLRVFKARPHPTLVQTYGAAFAAALESAPVGEWRAYATDEGWRAVRVDAVMPAQPADFDNLRGVVLQDWTDATMAEQRTAAVRALGRKYVLKFEDAPQ